MSNRDILESTTRLVTWRINDFDALDEAITSKEFMISNWCWQLECQRQYYGTLVIKLKLIDNSRDGQSLQIPIASVIYRMHYPFGSPKLTRLEIILFGDSIDTKISSTMDARFGVKIGKLNGKTPFVISLEFIDLKVALENDGKSNSIWDEEYSKYNSSYEPVGKTLSRGIYADIIINTINESIEAHKAVLAANSPFFTNMFANNLKEKETSTIDIKHVSTEACKAMLDFIYGKRGGNEFRSHRMELVAIAHMYDIVALKEACEASLCEDVGEKNVFERLKCASTYELLDLKSVCLFYLVKMGTIYELREGYNSFLHEADYMIIAEVSNACLDSW